MRFDPVAYAMGKAGAGRDLLSALMGAKNGGGGGNPRLPPEYQEVAYLANDGFCWCQVTDVRPKNGHYCELIIDIASDASSGENGIIGAGKSSNGDAWEIYFSSNSIKFYQKVVGTQIDNIVRDTKYTVIGQFTSNSYWYWHWGRYNTANYPFKGKMYSLRFYALDGEDQINDLHFIPCYRKADNVPGFYDVVNSTFYTNSGTGTFGIGPDVN